MHIGRYVYESSTITPGRCGAVVDRPSPSHSICCGAVESAATHFCEGIDPLTRQLIDEFDANGPTPLFHALSYAWSHKTCVGYGWPESGLRVCGKERDDDKQWCDSCQDSADLDNGSIHFDYPHLAD